MRLNKFEAKEYRRKKLEKDLRGEGLYLYRNATKGTLMLPKPTANGVRNVSRGQEFEGDNYFMELVRTNQCRLVREIMSPKQQKEIVMNEKLILDQPETVTNEGPVEHVCCGGKTCGKPLNEAAPVTEQTTEVLLTEDPLNGVDILDD